MRVWGGCFDGTTRQIVAAKTKKAAAEALGVSLYHFNNYGGETGNDLEVSVAMQCPGTPYSAPVSGMQEDRFVPGLVRYIRGHPWTRDAS